MPTALAPVLATILAVTPTVLVPAPLERAPEAPRQVVESAASTAPPRALSPGRPAGTPSGAPTGAPTGAPSGGAAMTPASGVWPLAPAPEVVRGFDPPVSTYGAGHRGVDLLGSPGQPVRAAASGRVTYAGLLAGRGVVVIGHGPTRTTYQPVDAEVTVGSLVEAGQGIGTLQASGSHCAPAACLHWGLVEGSTYLDPLSLLGAGAVRLFPLAGSSRR